MSLKIIDYDKKYCSQIDELQKSQWGEGSETDDILNNIENYFVKIVLDNDELIGTLVAHLEKELCFLDFIIIKPKYQKQGIGTNLMKLLIEFAKQNNCKTVECEAIGVFGKINSKNLLENFEFKKIETVENYWGEKCPTFFCKECNQMPCVCSMNKYVKIL